jgi:hypothetical protein
LGLWIAFPLIGATHLKLLTGLILAAGVADSLVMASCGGLMVRTLPTAAQGKASAWAEAGQLGGGAFERRLGSSAYICRCCLGKLCWNACSYYCKSAVHLLCRYDSVSVDQWFRLGSVRCTSNRGCWSGDHGCEHLLQRSQCRWRDTSSFHDLARRVWLQQIWHARIALDGCGTESPHIRSRRDFVRDSWHELAKQSCATHNTSQHVWNLTNRVAGSETAAVLRRDRCRWHAHRGGCVR